MLKRGFVLLGALAFLSIATGSAFAANDTLTIGYLELKGDSRYFEDHLDARYPAQPWGRPYPGAEVALQESRFAGLAAGVQLELRRASAENQKGLQAALKQMIDDGVQFALLDLPGQNVAELARTVKDQSVILFNVSSLADALRQDQCQANLFHLAPSRVMLTDALAQYLVSKKWRELFVLKGPRPGDKSYFKAFQRSAKRYGLEVQGVEKFVLGVDPRERESNNVALLTSGASAQVVVVVDSDGEFARAVPYQTQKPVPVVGAAGLVADWWHWAWQRHGAPQLNERFLKHTGRLMTGYDWAAWAGVKTVAQAVQRARSGDFEKLRDYILSDDFVLDGFKGYRIDFRSWNHQLRQPVFLTTLDWVVARAPLEGFLHRTNNLDTLGFDERESECDLGGWF